MRLALMAATAATIIATGMTLSTPSFSAAKKATPATKSVNECIALARQRGYASSDLDSGGAGSNRARDFVIRCLQGREK